MRTLDLARPYGTVHPPTPVNGSERLQVFEQHDAATGKPIAFDRHGNEIIPGGVAPRTSLGKLSHEAIKLLERLVGTGDKMPRDTLLREAGLVLGEVPATKLATMDALRARLTLHRAGC